MFRIPRFLTRNPLFYRTRDLWVQGPLFNARRWICRPKDAICTYVRRLVWTPCAWRERVDNERDRELGRRPGVRMIATPCGQQGKGPAAVRLGTAWQDANRLAGRTAPMTSAVAAFAPALQPTPRIPHPASAGL